MMDLFLEPAFWATLAMLVGLELALGVDNIVFVSLILSRVPESQRNRARQIGLAVSAIVQVALLFIMLWIAGVDRAAFSIAGWMPSWSELAFLAGGLFLVYKAVSELHIHIEFGPRKVAAPPAPAANLSFAAVIAQIAVINAVFSVDTIITAVGITRSAETIVIAIIMTTVSIYFATAPISAFIARHRSVRGLALAFLLIVGGSLISEGLGIEPDVTLLYAVFGVGTAVLAIVKIADYWRCRPEAEAAAQPAREEPVLEPLNGTSDPVRDEEALEKPASDVQQSGSKRRAPRRKSVRKSKASPQG